MLGRGNICFWVLVAAMAGSAGDFVIGVILMPLGVFASLIVIHLDHADVVVVDLPGHGEHQPGGILFRLGIIREIEPWPAVGADVFGIGGVAGVAMHAELALPPFHDVAYLLAGQIFRQHLQIGWLGKLAWRRTGRALRWRSGWGPLRLLGRDGEGDGQRGGHRSRQGESR